MEKQSKYGELLMNGIWPMSCHDIQHTGRSTVSTINNLGVEKWRFSSGIVDGGMIIANDGTIYFGGRGRKLFALYPDGTEKWRYTVNDWIWSTPTLADDGTIYIGDYSGTLYALYQNGTLKWQYEQAGSISSSPAIGNDGTIYFGTMGPTSSIFAVNPNGTEKWRYQTGYYITSDPAIGPDETIYIGSGDTYVYAMNPNGTLKWRFKTGHYVKGPPSIAPDGTVYIGSWDGYLYALNPDNGSMIWRCQVGSGTETNPSIAEDGAIYVGGDELYAVNPNGTMKWVFNLGDNRHIFQSCPAISAEGIIYVGVDIGVVGGGEILAVNPNGTERWRKLISDEWCDSSPAIAADGTVYIGSATSQGGYLHAFGTIESNEPPQKPTITAPSEGKVGEKYWIKFMSYDPDNNPLQFYVDWGDGTSEWSMECASNELFWIQHTWEKRGTYTIKAKAIDVTGAESDWATLEIKMPKTFDIPIYRLVDRFFERLLNNHPHLFPILRQLLSSSVNN